MKPLSLLLGAMLLLADLFGQVPFSKDALWITAPSSITGALRPCPVYVRTFKIAHATTSAHLVITAHGLYECHINGIRVSEDYFCPGYTNYNKRLQYQEYDISQLLRVGPNTITVTVGDGWYRGYFGGWMRQDNYGKDAAMICEARFIFADGHQQQLCSDTSWRVGSGPILSSDIYGGEIQDTRLGLHDQVPVSLIHFEHTGFITSVAPPVREHEIFSPRTVQRQRDSTVIIDFGQNLAGWVQLEASGRAGDSIKIEHAEMLLPGGDLFTGNLRDAKATDVYVLNGRGYQLLKPHFTWHGFRYAKITKGLATIRRMKAVALYSDMPPAGEFTCSNAQLNHLQHNIEWSMKSNFLDIPSDCPQRSERLGWTGDAQIFLPTAAFMFDVKAFFTKWLADLRSEQFANGAVPNIIPNIYFSRTPANPKGVAGWGDAAVIIPWELYQQYGDTSILGESYSSMKAWERYISTASDGWLWQTGGYGDWLAPGDSTSVPFIDQCYWAHTLQLLKATAHVLRFHEDEEDFRVRLDSVKLALYNEYLLPAGKIKSNTQTAYALILAFELLPEPIRPIAAARLDSLVKANAYRLATGFLGTPVILQALSENGYWGTAGKLLFQDSCPSWLYPIGKGATTIWEKWDAVRPDGSLSQTSFNHYAYGAVGHWMYENIAGLKIKSPGGDTLEISPVPIPGITWVRATHKTGNGLVKIYWHRTGKRFILDLHLPPGTNASILLPNGTQVVPKGLVSHFECRL